jgi:hypothetical protein
MASGAASSSKLMYAAPPEREFIAAYVRLSRLPNVPASSSFPVKSIVRKYREASNGDTEDNETSSVATLLSAAEWAEALLLNNVSWLVQLAVRNLPKGRDPRSEPVLVSLGGEGEVLILWDEMNPLSKAIAPVRRVNVAVTLSADENAVAMDGHKLVERYGCLQPKDCLYEHLRCELDFAVNPDSRPTLYLSTERAPWALYASMNDMPAKRSSNARELHKLRVLRIHTSSSGRSGSFVPERVESLPNPDAYLAVAYGAGVGSDGTDTDEREAAEEDARPQPYRKPPPTSGRPATAVISHAEEEDEEDSSHDGSDEAPPPQGFTPRELLLLVRAYRDEPYSEKEAKWDVNKVLQKDIHECDKILREDVNGPRKPRSSSETGAATQQPVNDSRDSHESSAAAKLPPAPAGKSAPGASSNLSANEKDSLNQKAKDKSKEKKRSEKDDDEKPHGEKKRGRPKGSKNKPKDASAAKDAAVVADKQGASRAPGASSNPKASEKESSDPKAKSHSKDKKKSDKDKKKSDKTSDGKEPHSEKKRGRPKGSKNKSKDKSDDAATSKPATAPALKGAPSDGSVLKSPLATIDEANANSNASPSASASPSRKHHHETHDEDDDGGSASKKPKSVHDDPHHHRTSDDAPTKSKETHD